MQRHTVQLALAAGAALFAACDPPMPPGEANLVLFSNPVSIPSNGTTTTVTITATDAEGAPGTGTVDLTAAAGFWASGGRTGSVALTGGSASITFSCDRAADPACAATSVRMDATWVTGGETVTSFTNVTLTGGGGGGGGGDGGTGGGDGGTDSSGGLSLTASRSPIFTNVGDSSLITATLNALPDGGGGPVAGAAIDFTTSLGTLGPSDGGAAGGTSFSESTNAQGRAFAVLHAGNTPGAATVSATRQGGSGSASVPVTISNLAQITHISSACGSQSPCNLMGIRGSGRNEVATITFQVTDTTGAAASGIPVTFSLGTGAPVGATVSPNGVTNAQGRVQATLQSGSGIGVVSVTATVFPPIQTSSPGLGITGARVSNAGISILCEQVNIPAYISPTPPRDITVNCSVRLTDRYTNAIGFPTTVNFVAEAGTVSTSVTTVAFNFSNPSDPLIGRANFTFSTRGGTGRAFPVDVAPLAANPSQDPNPRFAEPSIPSGSLTLNPRDGLMTLVAYVNGEEYFYDANGNGLYDSGEQFYDQGERFVDANDNGVWDLGETFFDENNDTIWNGPDGVRQSDKQVWAEYRLLYTDYPLNGQLVPNPFSGDCATAPLARGTSVDLAIYAADLNLNRPIAGSTLAISHTASKGQVRLNGGTTLLDGYGFGMDRVLVNPNTNLLCQPADPICHFRTQFYGWSAGLLSTTGTVVAPPVTDTTPCAPDEARVTVTVLSVPILISASGALE